MPDRRLRELPDQVPVYDRKERRITRREHEDALEEVRRRLDENPEAMRVRRETLEHPFGAIKARMGATHVLMKRLNNVKTVMSLAVPACNLARIMNIVGIGPLIAAIREFLCLISPNHGRRGVSDLPRFRGRFSA